MLRAIYVDAVDDKGNAVRPSGTSADAIVKYVGIEDNQTSSSDWA